MNITSQTLNICLMWLKRNGMKKKNPNLISRLGLLSLDGLKLLLIVWAHVAPSSELPASIFQLATDKQETHVIKKNYLILNNDAQL